MVEFNANGTPYGQVGPLKEPREDIVRSVLVRLRPEARKPVRFDEVEDAINEHDRLLVENEGLRERSTVQAFDRLWDKAEFYKTENEQLKIQNADYAGGNQYYHRENTRLRETLQKIADWGYEENGELAAWVAQRALKGKKP